MIPMPAPRPLASTDHIRRLLAPERDHPTAAEGLPGVTIRVDDKPARIHPATDVVNENLPRVIAIQRVTLAGRWRAHAVRGLPTAAERRARTERALARLAVMPIDDVRARTSR